MELNLNTILLDNEEFMKMKLFQACMLLDSNSSGWIRVRSNLSAKYKFTVDLDTFSTVLGEGIRVLPSSSALWQKGSSVVTLYIRYDFEHEQDSAVKELLISGLTNRNRLELNPSLTIPYVSHRFASLVPPYFTGVIRLNVEQFSTDNITKFISNWDTVLNTVYQTKLSYDSYHSFLESLNE